MPLVICPFAWNCAHIMLSTYLSHQHSTTFKPIETSHSYLRAGCTYWALALIKLVKLRYITWLRTMFPCFRQHPRCNIALSIYRNFLNSSNTQYSWWVRSMPPRNTSKKTKRCKHEHLTYTPTAHAEEVGYVQKTASQRLAATLPSGISKLPPKAAPDPIGTFPAPLLLPDDDLALP